MISSVAYKVSGNQNSMWRNNELTTNAEELAQWKQKYEALAKLYAQLRKEHLDLLNRFKDVKDSANRLTEEARREVEKVRGEMRVCAAPISQKFTFVDNVALDKVQRSDRAAH